MPVRLYQIDAFTDRPFAGNQAAVCVLDEPAPAAWMATLAGETDVPATAFVAPTDEDGADWSLRWFTATSELVLCGHGTLAASHALLREEGVDLEVIRYATVADILTARSTADGAVELDMPAHPGRPSPADAEAVRAALWPDGTGPAVEAVRGFEDLLVVAPTAADVVRATPDAGALAAVPARCVIVSAAGAGSAEADGADIVSRVFAPSVGVAEDPVTGSAHCLLGPYWSARLGRDVLDARQASARGGRLRVEVRGDRVGLVGHAVTVLRAELDPAALPS